MSERVSYILQIISTFSVVIPLAFALWLLKRIDLKLKLFVLFLGVGLTTDLLGWYCYLSNNNDINLVVRYGYNLLEPVFLLWFLSRFTMKNQVKIIFLIALIVLIPFWIFCIYFWGGLGFFKSATQVLIAFGACICLLNTIEDQENVMKERSIWLMLGIFFYNFCTFFFMTLLPSEIGGKLWYIHNLINILTNLIFWLALSRQDSTMQLHYKLQASDRSDDLSDF